MSRPLALAAVLVLDPGPGRMDPGPLDRGADDRRTAPEGDQQ